MKYFLDLGACVGATIDKAQILYPSHTVIAFEPLPDNVKILREKYPNIHIMPVAASTRNGEAKLYLPKRGTPNAHESASLREDKANIKRWVLRPKSVTVKMIDFVQYLESLKDPEDIIVKIDIEGEEYDLLNYLISSGAIKKISKLYVEWHGLKLRNFNMADHWTLVKKLQGLGYDLNGDNYHDEFSRIKATT